jgi:hypothetical protein
LEAVRVLDEVIVTEIVAFIDVAEERASKPFNQFADLSALEMVDLNFKFVFHIGLHRRLASAPHSPVKSAFYVTSPKSDADRLFPARRGPVYGTRSGCEMALRPSRSTDGAALVRSKYWEIIANRLMKDGWSWSCVSAIDSNG